jgi:hypothetical protein
MKKLVLSLAFALLAGVVFSQSNNDYMEVERAALKTEKKALIADAMQLTEDESKTFWPLYNEYNEKLYLINTKVYELIDKYAKEYDKLSDEQAIELWNENIKIKKEAAKLETAYFKKFQKIISGKKVLRYFQAESKVDALIAYELAAEIPLAE